MRKKPNSRTSVEAEILGPEAIVPERNQHKMHALTIAATAVLITVLLFPVAALGQAHVDLILVHGTIWTENPRQPEAEAVAIQGNRIVEVGESEAILKLAGPKTKVIDLKGRRVVPGFNDAHVHF
jgi:hypothetical protein